MKSGILIAPISEQNCLGSSSRTCDRMNENKSSWVDRANLASNILQNIQLQEVHSTLRAVRDLQIQKARLDLTEQQLRQREDRLREHLWQMEQAFESVLRDASVTPCAIYVLTKQVLDDMDRYKVAPASFREFSDKDRIGSFMQKLQQANKDSFARMSAEQRSDTEKFLNYEVESTELNSLVERLRSQNQERCGKIEKAKKRKDAAASKLEILRAKVDMPGAKAERLAAIGRFSLAKIGVVILAAPAGAAWLSLLFYLGIPIYGFLGDGNDVEDGRLFAIGLGILVVAVVLTAASIVLHRKSQLPKSIKEQIALREKEIRDAHAMLVKLEQPNPEDKDIKKFRVKDLDALIRLRDDREAFVFQFRQANNLSLERVSQQSINEREMSPEVQELARRADKKILAIMLFKEQSGVSLVEARRTVEGFFERVHSQES